MPIKDNSSLVLSDAAKKAKEPKQVRPDRPSQGFGLAFLDQNYTIVNATGGPAAAIAWTTYDASQHVPTTAKGLVLTYRAMNNDAPTGEKGIYVRRERGSVEMQIAAVEGTNVADITSNAGQAFVEMTSSKTFDYKFDAMSEQEMAVVGYYT